jgi:hypothetical protein
VEVVFIQLANEAGEIAVFEVLWQDVFGEFLVLLRRVRQYFQSTPWKSRTSKTTKLSPSLPHRTTLSSWGFSSILHCHCQRVIPRLNGTGDGAHL